MSKFFLNIFFIIIMGLCLTVVPINIDMLDFQNLSFDFSSPDNDEALDEAEETISVFAASIPEENYLYNPSILDITIKSIDNLSAFQEKLENNLVIEVYKFDSQVKALGLGDLGGQISVSSSEDVSMLELNLPIDRTSIDLKTGHYIVKIKGNVEDSDLFKDLEYKITYIDDKKYMASTNENNNKNLATIYYPDKQLWYSVPVTREVSSRKNSQIRSVLNAILEGPGADSGLNAGQAGPYIPRAYISNGILTLNANSSDLKVYDNGSAMGVSAIDTMVKSLTKLPNVEEIKFLVDGSDNGLYFHGMSIKDSFKEDVRSKAYLGLSNSSQFNYLLPLDFSDPSDVRIEDMFEVLKHGELDNVAGYDLIQTIPQNVELIDYSIDANTLSLNLSGEFLSAYNSSEDYSLLMIDSLVYSYTSFDGIDSVKILVDGNQVDDFFGINISSPMIRPNFINPRFN